MTSPKIFQSAKMQASEKEMRIDRNKLIGDPGIAGFTEIQNILYNIKDENYSEKMNNLRRFDATDFFLRDLIRSIMRFSVIFRTKSKIYVKICKEIEPQGRIQKIAREYLSFGIKIGAFSFIKLLFQQDSEFNAIYSLQSSIRLYEIFKKDDLEGLKEVASYPEFDFDQVETYIVPYIIDERKYANLSLIECAALYGSRNCFKYLINNEAHRVPGNKISLVSYTIVGGNFDIIQILETSRIHPTPEDLLFAIRFQRREFFDWIIKIYQRSFNAAAFSECAFNEFTYGLQYSAMIDPSESFEKSCQSGFIQLTIFLCDNYRIEGNSFAIGFREACKAGHFEIIKYLVICHTKSLANLRSFEDSPIDIARENHHNNIVRYLKRVLNEYGEFNINPNEFDPRFGDINNLIIACKTNSIEMVRMLVDTGRFNVNEIVILIFFLFIFYLSS